MGHPRTLSGSSVPPARRSIFRPTTTAFRTALAWLGKKVSRQRIRPVAVKKNALVKNSPTLANTARMGHPVNLSGSSVPPAVNLRGSSVPPAGLLASQTGFSTQQRVRQELTSKPCRAKGRGATFTSSEGRGHVMGWLSCGLTLPGGPGSHSEPGS